MQISDFIINIQIPVFERLPNTVVVDFFTCTVPQEVTVYSIAFQNDDTRCTDFSCTVKCEACRKHFWVEMGKANSFCPPLMISRCKRIKGAYTDILEYGILTILLQGIKDSYCFTVMHTGCL